MVTFRLWELQDLNKFAAAALLRYFSWNKEKVIDNFCNDPEKTKERAGIMHFVTEFQTSPTSKFCRICVEECPAQEVIAMGCGHFFCRTCYTNYLCNKVRTVMWPEQPGFGIRGCENPTSHFLVHEG
jgi:ariadne-1